MKLTRQNKRNSKDRHALTGVRAVAAGAALYTAGRAAFKGLRGQFSPSPAADDVATHAREERAPGEHRRRRRAPAKDGLQPSLDLPQQRWPRMAAGRR